MNDHDFSSGEDAFTAEEQAAFEAYASGSEPAVLESAAAPAAPEGGAAAASAEPAAPGEVVDPDAEGADDAEANRGRFVRHGAFHKEREGRKAQQARADAAERELSEIRQKYARGDERLRLLTETMQRPGAPATPEAPVEPPKKIDPAEDIFGAYAQLQQELEAIRSGQTQQSEALKREEQERQEEAARGQVINTYRADIQAAAQADPTFVDAYRHLIDGRVSELKLLGFADADAVAAVNAEEFTIVQSALQRGQSPAQVVLQLAKGRGFVAKAPEPAPEPAKPQETAVEKAARVAAGQAGPGKSLSAAGGAPAGELTLEMLSSMSEAEFEKVLASNPGRVRALMGA